MSRVRQTTGERDAQAGKSSGVNWSKLQRGRAVTVPHPNSTAARKWKRSTFTSYAAASDMAASTRPPATLGASRRRRRGGGTYTTREEARQVACPVCGAPVGDYCSRRNGTPRLSAHEVRHQLAIKTGATPSRSTRKPTSTRSSTARDKR